MRIYHTPVLRRFYKTCCMPKLILLQVSTVHTFNFNFYNKFEHTLLMLRQRFKKSVHPHKAPHWNLHI